MQEVRHKLLSFVVATIGIVGCYLGAWWCMGPETSQAILAIFWLMLGTGLLIYVLLYFRLLFSDLHS